MVSSDSRRGSGCSTAPRRSQSNRQRQAPADHMAKRKPSEAEVRRNSTVRGGLFGRRRLDESLLPPPTWRRKPTVSGGSFPTAPPPRSGKTSPTGRNSTVSGWSIRGGDITNFSRVHKLHRSCSDRQRQVTSELDDPGLQGHPVQRVAIPPSAAGLFRRGQGWQAAEEEAPLAVGIPQVAAGRFRH